MYLVYNEGKKKKDIVTTSTLCTEQLRRSETLRKCFNANKSKKYVRASANRHPSHSPDSFAMWKIMRTYITGNQIDAKYSLYSFYIFFFSLVFLVNLISFGRLRFVNKINYNSQPSARAQKTSCLVLLLAHGLSWYPYIVSMVVILFELLY